jgi:hypothetical protein
VEVEVPQVLLHGRKRLLALRELLRKRLGLVVRHVIRGEGHASGTVLSKR